MRRRQSNPSNTGGKGAKRMREFGLRPVTIWLDEKERRLVDQAATADGLRVATWVRKIALESARS